MIKSSKTTLKFSNRHRRDDILELISEYRDVMRQFISILWNKSKISRMADKATCAQIHTWLSARMIQCAGKQASAIVLGTRAKQERRKYVIEKMISEGETKDAKRLQKIYDEASISMPELENVEMELDSRFISFDWSNSTSFDGWITISSIGNKKKILIPVKKTRHFNRLLGKCTKLHEGIRLSRKEVTFMFDMPEIKSNGKQTLGIDIGLKDALSCSNGQQIGKDKHGWTYQKICNVLARKKKGSKSFERTQRHRTNFLH